MLSSRAPRPMIRRQCFPLYLKHTCESVSMRLWWCKWRNSTSLLRGLQGVASPESLPPPPYSTRAAGLSPQNNELLRVAISLLNLITTAWPTCSAAFCSLQSSSLALQVQPPSFSVFVATGNITAWISSTWNWLLGDIIRLQTTAQATLYNTCNYCFRPSRSFYNQHPHAYTPALSPHIRHSSLSRVPSHSRRWPRDLVIFYCPHSSALLSRLTSSSSISKHVTLLWPDPPRLEKVLQRGCITFVLLSEHQPHSFYPSNWPGVTFLHPCEI